MSFDDHLNDKADRFRDFIQQAINEQRPPRSEDAGVYNALSNVLQELERIRYGETVGMDGRDLAREALGDLMYIWVDADQVDEIWLGQNGEEAPRRP